MMPRYHTSSRPRDPTMIIASTPQPPNAAYSSDSDDNADAEDDDERDAFNDGPPNTAGRDEQDDGGGLSLLQNKPIVVKHAIPVPTKEEEDAVVSVRDRIAEALYGKQQPAMNNKSTTANDNKPSGIAEALYASYHQISEPPRPSSTTDAKSSPTTMTHHPVNHRENSKKHNETNPAVSCATTRDSSSTRSTKTSQSLSSATKRQATSHASTKQKVAVAMKPAKQSSPKKVATAVAAADKAPKKPGMTKKTLADGTMQYTIPRSDAHEPVYDTVTINETLADGTIQETTEKREMYPGGTYKVVSKTITTRQYMPPPSPSSVKASVPVRVARQATGGAAPAANVVPSTQHKPQLKPNHNPQNFTLALHRKTLRISGSLSNMQVYQNGEKVGVIKNRGPPFIVHGQVGDHISIRLIGNPGLSFRVAQGGGGENLVMRVKLATWKGLGVECCRSDNPDVDAGKFDNWDRPWNPVAKTMFMMGMKEMVF